MNNIIRDLGSFTAIMIEVAPDLSMIEEIFCRPSSDVVGIFVANEVNIDIITAIIPLPGYITKLTFGLKIIGVGIYLLNPYSRFLTSRIYNGYEEIYFMNTKDFVSIVMVRMKLKGVQEFN